MIDKLEPRWIGPFKVFDHDERGNYALVDALGNGLPKKYPIEKLKIVPKEQMREDIVEVDKIINDRTSENKTQYLVVWKNGDQIWTNEDDFQTIECINDYWKEKGGHGMKRKRGRPGKVPNPAKNHDDDNGSHHINTWSMGRLRT